MSMMLGEAAARITLDISDVLSGSAQAQSALNNLGQAGQSSMGGFWDSVERNNQAITTMGKGMTAVGAGILSGFVAPIALGTKSAFGYANSMEQSRVALNAYETDGRKVDTLLGDLVEYSQADRSGGLFFVDELAAAATNMIVYGAETDSAAKYTEILSRSVGLGTGNWDDLGRVIGRVGSTGRMTGTDFDMLTKMGYQLDDSIRNTDMTWDQLFENLDRGIPAEALEGQAGTIRAAMAWLRGGILQVGADFLGLDLITGQFAEGSLGQKLVHALGLANEGLRSFAPTAAMIGGVLATLAGFVIRGVEAFLSLPGPIKTAVFAVTGLFGAFTLLSGLLLLALPRIAAFRTALIALGGLSGVFRLLGTAVRVLVGSFLRLTLLNPVVLGLVAAGALLYAAWSSNFLGIRDIVGNVIDGVTGFIDRFRSAWNRLTDNSVMNTIHEIGGLADRLRDPISKVEAVFRALAEAIRGIGDGDIGWLNTIADGFDRIADVGGGVMDFFGGFRDAWNDLSSGNGMDQIHAWGGLEAGPGVGGIDRFFGSVSAGLRAIRGDETPEFFVNLADRVDEAGENVQKFSDYMGEIWETKDMARFGRDVRSMLGRQVPRAFDGLGRTAQRAFRGIGGNLLDLAAEFPRVEAPLRNFGIMFNNTGDAINSALSGVGHLVRGDFSSAMTSFRASLSSGLSAVGNLTDGLRTIAEPIRDWVIDVGIPRVTGWISENAGRVWEAIKTIAGWAWSGLQQLGAWALETAIPTVAGWIASAASNVWEAIKTVVGWAWSGLQQLGAWTLETAIPAIAGWISTAAGNVWEAIKSIAGWVWGGAQQLGAWVLETAIPTVAGWIATAAGNVWEAIKSVVGWTWENIAKPLGAWILETAVPTIGGWIASAASRVWQAIKDVVGWDENLHANLGEWWLDVAQPTITGWIRMLANNFWPVLRSAAGLAQSLVANILVWVLSMAAPDVNFEEDLNSSVSAAIGAIAVAAVDWALGLAAPGVSFEEDLNSSVLAAVELIAVSVTKSAWNLLMGDPAVSFRRWIGFPIIDAIADITIRTLDWAIKLTDPDVDVDTDGIKRLIAAALVGLTIAAVATTIPIAPLLIIVGLAWLGWQIANTVADWIVANPIRTIEIILKFKALLENLAELAEQAAEGIVEYFVINPIEAVVNVVLKPQVVTGGGEPLSDEELQEMQDNIDDSWWPDWLPLPKPISTPLNFDPGRWSQSAGPTGRAPGGQDQAQFNPRVDNREWEAGLREFQARFQQYTPPVQVNAQALINELNRRFATAPQQWTPPVTASLQQIAARFQQAPPQWTPPVQNALTAIRGGFQTSLGAVPMIASTHLGGARTHAITQTAGMRTGVVGGLGGLVTGAMGAMTGYAGGVNPHFSGVSLHGRTTTGILRTGVVGSIGGMVGGAAASMAGYTGGINPNFTNVSTHGQATTGLMRAGVTGSIGGMVGSSIASLVGMRGGSATQFSGMTAHGTGQSAALNSNVTGTTGTMRGNVLSRLSGMASGALTNFTGMQRSGTTQSSTMRGNVTGATSGMQGTASGLLSRLSGDARSRFGDMQGSGTRESGTMRGNVTTNSQRMQTDAGRAFQQMAREIEMQMRNGTRVTQSESSQWARIIQSQAGPMRGAGQAAGSAAGQGVVAGLRGQLGAVQGVANEISRTVQSALNQSMRIRSPSKVTEEIGEQIGAGLVVGMRHQLTDVERVSRQLATAATPELSGPLTVADLRARTATPVGLQTPVGNTIQHHTHSTTVHVGGIHVTEAGDARETARYVVRELGDALDQFGGVGQSGRS